MKTYSHMNNFTVRLSEKKRDPQTKDSVRFIIHGVEKQEHQPVCEEQSSSSESQTAEDIEPWTDSTDAESTCSVFESQTGSEEGSPWKKLTRDTPPSRSGILLKGPMLGDFPAAWKKRFSFNYTMPKTPLWPLRSPLKERENLIRSPSHLLLSPTRGLSRSLHPEGRDALETLFEDVWVTPESTILKSPSLPGSFVDDSETSLSAGSGNSQSLSEEGHKSSPEETPEQLISLKRARKLCPHRRTSRRRITSQPNTKKKCVNGFIMFCRMNRKLYIRSYPGIPSTTVTKELANLWHILPKRERRLYCLKACSFSRKQNRNVRTEVQEAETKAESSVPSPLHMLLAYRDLFAAAK